MARAITVAVCVLIAACATEIEAVPFTRPSGKAAYSMRCGGDLDACYRRAGELCPRGWNIVNQTGHAVALPIYGGGAIAVQRRGNSPPTTLEGVDLRMTTREQGSSGCSATAGTKGTGSGAPRRARQR